MNKNELKKQFQNESEQMNKYHLASIRAQLDYENAENNLNPELDKYAKNLNKAEYEEDVYTELYAKKIFDYLKILKPDLIRRRNNQKVLWDEAFGMDYSMLSNELKGSLVALVEEDGGQYRLE